MEQSIRPCDLSDDELLRRFAAIVTQSRRNEAEIVAHLAAVDERRLYLGQACASSFSYCTGVLHFSEAEAFLRITVARASRKHPMLLPMLADGRLHLSAIVRIAPHLTAANCGAVLARAVHRSKREVDELVAELAPKPDVPAAIRKLPDRQIQRAGQIVFGGSETMVAPMAASSVAAPKLSRPGGATSAAESEGTKAPAEPQLVPDGVRALASSSAAGGARRRDAVEPTAPGRYRVQFTASAAFRGKLERLLALMAGGAGGNDLAAVIEQAVTEKLERLEARRFGGTKRPAETRSCSRPRPAKGRSFREEPPERRPVAVTATRSPESPQRSPSDATSHPKPKASRHIPAPVRRAVYARDGGRCTYMDAQGRRCESRTHLELHHRYPWAYGGRHQAGDVTLLCSGHHSLMTEADFGRRGCSRTPSPGLLASVRNAERRVASSATSPATCGRGDDPLIRPATTAETRQTPSLRATSSCVAP